jgi:UDP-glucose 4-epimerase
VLVTGGAGLIGSHIVEYLVEAGAGEIRVLDSLIRGQINNLASAMARKSISVIPGDVRDPGTVSAAMAGCDYVFHQAAMRSVLCAECPRECIDVLVNGTLNVFDAAVNVGVKKVVYASSGSIYGAADTLPTGESHPPYNNRTLYGAAKLMNEGIAHSFHEMYGLPAVGLRYFYVYGPRMEVSGAYSGVIIRWLDRLAQGLPPQIHGDGLATMDYIYVEDAARANLLAMQSNQTDSVFNVGSGTETSLLDLCRTLCEASGLLSMEPLFVPAQTVKGVPHRLADTSEAALKLGFVAEVGLRDGLERLIAWRQQTVQAQESSIAQRPVSEPDSALLPQKGAKGARLKLLT